MKKEFIISSIIIFPKDDAATIAAKKNTLVQALTAGQPECPNDTLTGLQRAYEIARTSETTAEEKRLMRAIHRTLEMRKFQR